MSKLKIIDKKSESNIKSEKEFLTKLHHSFIVNMHYAFQDFENLYLVIDYLSGGDLRYHLCRKRIFSEEQTSKNIKYLNNFNYRIFYCLYFNKFRIYS